MQEIRKMDDKVPNRKLYKIPSNNILDNRREFYNLTKNVETKEKWLERVSGHIDDCDFSKKREYILADRFICELNTEEQDHIRTAGFNWSKKCPLVSVKNLFC